MTSPQPSEARAQDARATIDALTASTDVFESFFDRARIGLALADLTSRYVRVNETYAALLGQAPEDLIGVPFAQVLHPDDRPAKNLRTELLLTGAESSLEAEERYVALDGRTLWVLHTVSLVRGDDGRPQWFAVSAQDISERRRAEEDLRSLTATLAERAVRDPLTGLANRVLLEERLRAALSRDARDGRCTALLFLDLDGFKAVNDRHGHAAGDAVLSTIAARLRAEVRPADTVARIGGDEFVVLVEGATTTGVQALGDRLAAKVAEPVAFGSINLQVGVSIGTALAQGGDAEPQALLALADSRMYAEKGVDRPGAGLRRGPGVPPGGGRTATRRGQV